MAKKDYFMIIDTETTITDKVADFGAIIIDRKGTIVNQCAVLIADTYLDRENNPLFYVEGMGDLWAKKSLDKRYNDYTDMLDKGSRVLASVNAVNRWLEKVKATYNPIYTAYNIAFDTDKCLKTNIDVAMFDKSFCLWHGAAEKWLHTKEYKQFILDTHSFNNPTELGNMSFKTNAEIMARFVLNNPELPDEPHTALEDIIFYELPIFKAFIKGKKKKDLENIKSFNWRSVQVKDHFKPK